MKQSTLGSSNCFGQCLRARRTGLVEIDEEELLILIGDTVDKNKYKEVALVNELTDKIIKRFTTPPKKEALVEQGMKGKNKITKEEISERRKEKILSVFTSKIT